MGEGMGENGEEMEVIGRDCGGYFLAVRRVALRLREA